MASPVGAAEPGGHVGPMGLARELARKALLGAIEQGRPVDEALDAAVTLRAQQGDLTDSVLRKSASHARAIVRFGRVAGEPVLRAAEQRLRAGGNEDDLRTLLLEVNLQDALAARSAANTERAHQLLEAGSAAAFYAAVGHVAEPLASSPVDFALALVDASPDCIKIVSLDGRLLFMSENGRCALHIDDFGTVAGRPWSELWPEPERPKIEQAVARGRTGLPTRFVGSAPTAAGVPKTWDVHVNPILGGESEICALLAVSRERAA